MYADEKRAGGQAGLYRCFALPNLRDLRNLWMSFLVAAEGSAMQSSVNCSFHTDGVG
jgi:hypothetical protein